MSEGNPFLAPGVMEEASNSANAINVIDVECTTVKRDSPFLEDGTIDPKVILKTNCKICGIETDFTDKNSIGYMKSIKGESKSYVRETDIERYNVKLEINFPEQILICLDCFRKETDILAEYVGVMANRILTGSGNYSDVMQPIRIEEKTGEDIV